MYERFYQLRERPFALSPDPDYLYPSRVHREALSYLRYGIEGQAGFVVITGEIGSGKTTLLQTLLRGLDRETTVARLVNTMLEPNELLESILIDFGLEPEPRKPGHAPAARRISRERARRRTTGAARRRRGPEPDAARSRRSADALQPRDREVEADSDCAGRTAGPAREARVSPSSSSCGSVSPSATISGRSMRRIRRPTSTTGCGARPSARRSSSLPT